MCAHTLRGGISYQRFRQATQVTACGKSAHAHTCRPSHLDTNILQYEQSHNTLPPTNSHKPRQNHRHIISLCPLMLTHMVFTCLVPLSLSSPLHGGLLWRLMRKTSKHAPSVFEQCSECGSVPFMG